MYIDFSSERDVANDFSRVAKYSQRGSSVIVHVNRDLRYVRIMDLMQNYSKLLTSRGLGAQCSKHDSVLLIIAVMTISEFEFEPHSRFHS